MKLQSLLLYRYINVTFHLGKAGFSESAHSLFILIKIFIYTDYLFILLIFFLFTKYLPLTNKNNGQITASEIKPIW